MSNIVAFSGQNDDADNQSLAREISLDTAGKATLTLGGVARIIGVSKQTLSYHFIPVSFSKSKLAQSLVSQGFEPVSFSTKGIPDTAVSIITSYYAFDAGERCTDEAKKAAKTFMAIGVRAYAQQVKGWSQPTYSLKEEIRKYLPSNPANWEKRFGDDFWFHLHETYGLKRGQLGCASFIRCYIYGWFPAEVQARLDEINPLIRTEGAIATRKDRNHQYFRDELLEQLIYHIFRVTDILMISDDKQEFKKLMKAVPKYTFQRTLPGQM